MTREQFHERLKAGDILPCYLFEGEEEYTKQAALDSLRRRVLSGGFPELNYAVLQDPSADELIAVAETLPMMAEKRFVLVREPSLLGGRAAGEEAQGEAQGKTRGDDGADRLVQYVGRLPDTLCLVFYVQGKANGSRKLYKQLARQGAVVSFDTPDQPTLIKWMARELKAYDKRIDRATAEQLLFAVGQDMHLLHNELAKAAAHAGERDSVSGEDVEAVCIKTTEYKVFDLSDAVVAGQASRASALMNDMLRGGEQRLMLLSLLQRQYRQLLYARLLSGQKLSPEALARRLGVPPFVGRKLQHLAARYSVERLKWAYDLLIDTEFLVKSGQIPEEGSLEQALYQLLGARQESGR